MQAPYDDRVVAAADGRPFESVNASSDLEICPRATTLWLLVACFAMTLFSASLAFGWWDGLGDYDTFAGFVGVVVFAALTIRLIWILPTQRGAVVVVTPYGIRDLRIGNEFLLWDSIAAISAERSRGHKMIVLTPTPALRQQLRSINNLAQCAQDDRIVIRSDGLAADFESLLQSCRTAHAAALSRAALQQEDERIAQGFALQAS